MVNRMLTYLSGTAPYVLHRLDMDTSGLLLFAKQQHVVPGVHQQFRWGAGGQGVTSGGGQ